MWSIPKYHHHHLLFALFTQYKKFIIVIECAHHNFSFCRALELRRQNMQKRVSGQINNATKNTLGKVVGEYVVN